LAKTIYHLSSAPFSGGAARAGFRLHEGLLREPEVESIWLNAGTGAGFGNWPAVRFLRPGNHPRPLRLKLERWLWSRIMQRHFNMVAPISSNPLGWGCMDMLTDLPSPDLWNLHYVAGFMEWNHFLPALARIAPVVWTMHDMNPLMGVWHYSVSDGGVSDTQARYNAWAEQLKSDGLHKIRLERIQFVAPSKWMQAQCASSPITSHFPVEHIPYGLDLDLFSPREPEVFRKIFEIPREAFVVGFIADHITDPRKGMSALMPALNSLARKIPNLVLVAVGQGALKGCNVPLVEIGPISNTKLLPFFYSACDLFVCPSLQDNYPNTLLEAMGCGIPCVGFATGGVPELIENGVTGFVAETVGNSNSLACAIEKIIHMNSEMRKGMGLRAREAVLDRNGLQMQAEKYLQVYKKFLATR
jgi:glycosyltransferase involved in cell wall biosynthesis